jgi:hypothetical protein
MTAGLPTKNHLPSPVRGCGGVSSTYVPASFHICFQQPVAFEPVAGAAHGSRRLDDVTGKREESAA